MSLFQILDSECDQRACSLSCSEDRHHGAALWIDAGGATMTEPGLTVPALVNNLTRKESSDAFVR
jgi:hypothetical protein